MNYLLMSRRFKMNKQQIPLRTIKLLSVVFICMWYFAGAQYGFAQPTVIRTLAYHQITSISETHSRGVPVISDEGNVAAFSLLTNDLEPNPIYAVNANGTGLRQIDLVDDKMGLQPFLDISSDGSTVVSSSGASVRLAGTAGSSGEKLLQFAAGRIKHIRISGDGTKVFFIMNADDTVLGTNQWLQRGVYWIDLNDRQIRKLVTATEVANLLGIDVGKVIKHPRQPTSLAVSNDGYRIIFSSGNNAEGSVQNGYRIFGINLDGSQLNQIAGPFEFANVGISSDGLTVAYNVTTKAGASEGWTIRGGVQRKVASNADFIFTDINNENDRVKLTLDGSQVYFSSGGSGYIFNSGGNGYFGVWTPGAPFPSRLGGGFRSCMDSKGKRVVYIFFDENNAIQYGIVEVNPASLGGAPSISDATFEKSYVVKDEGITVSAKSSPATSLHGEKINISWYQNGLYVPAGRPNELHDDGQQGDQVAGDDMFTDNNIVVSTSSTINDGPRSVRLIAELGSGLGRHATAIELAPFFVVSSPPAGTGPQITSINPNSGEVGIEVVITGTGFDPIPENNVVIFGNRPAWIKNATTTQLTVIVPVDLLPGTVLVTLSVTGQASNAVPFTIGGDPGSLNPPRNLTAQVSGTSVILNWEPPALNSTPATLLKINNSSFHIDRKITRTFPTLLENHSILSFSPANTATEINEIEPNNNPSQAQILTGASPINVTGTAEISDGGDIMLYDGEDDIEDLYKITIQEQGLKLNLFGFSSDCDIVLFTEDGSSAIDWSTTIGATVTEEINVPDLSIGAYLIGVTIYEPEPIGANQTSYKLTLEGNFGGGGQIPPNLQAYTIYRSNSPNAKDTGTKIAEVNKNTTTYTDPGLSRQTYYYQATAVYDVGESGPSNEATATIGQPVEGIPIFPDAVTPQIAGDEFWLDIKVGTDEKPVTNLFGVSYVLNYTQTDIIDVVTPHSINVVPGDFLGNDLVFVPMVDETGGNASIGISRKTGQGGVNGNGTIVRIKFVTKPETPNGSQITFSFTELTANDPNGTAIVLAPQTFTITIISGLFVWPGDTNNDGIVNQADVLPLGLFWRQTGPVRTNASTNWVGQIATPWTNKNSTYADANGDGIVNQADVLPLGLNWHKTHDLNPLFNENAEPISALYKPCSAQLSCKINGASNPGQEFSIEIYASDVTNLFGIAFELIYSPTTSLEPILTEAGMWMGDDVVFFPNIDTNAGTISIGITRKAGQGGVNGSGIVAKIKMKMSVDSTVGDTTELILQSLSANDPNGRSITFELINKTLVTNVKSAQGDLVPTNFDLKQNFPNPFNPETTIQYDLPTAEYIQIDVFNVLGQKIRTLIDSQKQAGSFTHVWDGRNDQGEFVVSGLYMYCIQAGSFVEMRKMLLMK
jgi:hypothetical protein